MNTTTRTLALAFALTSLPALAGRHGFHQGDGLNISTSGAPRSCADIKVRFGSRDVVREEQSFTVPGSVRTFRLDSPASGGIVVTGFDGRDYSVTACKFASSDSALRALAVTTTGGEVTVSEPGDETSGIYFLVKAPRNASLDLSATNGPMSITDVTGDLTLRMENGPLSLKNVHGKVEARTVNGPIGFSGGSGDWKVRAENGPVTAHLSGRRWDGGELVADAVNGPVTLRVDPEFESGIRVERTESSPFACRAAVCGESRRRDRDRSERTIELGSGTAVVKLRATNGPISIRDGAARPERDDE